MKHMKKLLSLLLVLCLVLSLSCTAFAAGAEKPLDGKTVILHSNDVHGAIDLYAAMAALKADYEAQGAEVILADAGDYSQGTVYVSVNKGADAVTMMNATGYDVVTLGNHEFDYGYAQLVENMKAAKFQVLCADVLGADGKTIYDANTIIEKGGVKIGFFGLETPEAQTKANPKLIQGLKFLAGADGKELYDCAAAQVADLKAKGADLVVCLAHLGVDESSEPYTSYDLAKNVQGIDFIIDGHSHTVMTAGPNGEPIQSTGTAFANIGVITIDNATKKIVGNELKAIWHTEKNADGKSVTVVDYKTRDEKVAAAAKAIIDPIDKAYGEKFAVSEVALNGAKAPNGNRDSETNLGDLITDAMLWKVLADAEITVPEENVVAITNGGGIRASIGVGDVTKKDINTVLPFGNTLAVVYVKGSELLEALEASTYCTPESIGGFPQVAGMQFTVATYETYDKNDESYPNSTYYGPKTINRVTIGSINGKDFDPEATYAVITNNFVAGGGDTYYAFAAATNQFDTGLPLDEVVMEYITKELKGVIGETYAEPAGRIVVDQGVAPAIADVQSMVMGEASYTAESYKAYAAVEAKLAAAETEAEPAGRIVVDQGVAPAIADVQSMVMGEASYTAESYKAYAAVEAKLAAAETEAERVALCAELRAAVSGLKIVENTFDDATSGWYKPAVDFAQASGLMSGMGDNKFAPDVTTTRAMVAQVMYELADEPDVSGLTCPLSDVDSTAWYADAVIWAYNAGVVSGYEDGTFRPGRAITRQEMAVMFYGMLFGTDSILAEDDIKLALGAFKDGDTVASWAREAVAVCYISGIMVGDNGSFKPTDLLSRAQLAQVFRSFYETQLTFALDELPAAPDQPSTPVQPSTPTAA